MTALSILTVKALGALLLAYFAVVVVKLFTGGICLNGLLRHSGGGRNFSPARVQLLVFTIATAIDYLNRVAHTPNAATLPLPPDNLLAVLGASQSLYLGSKTWNLLLGPWIEKFRRGDSQ